MTLSTFGKFQANDVVLAVTSPTRLITRVQAKYVGTARYELTNIGLDAR